MSTPRLGLPLPEGADQITTLTTGPHDIRQMATTLDDAAMFGQSVHSLRPAPAIPGRFWLSTDTGQVSIDTGSAWVELAAKQTAYTPPGVVMSYAGAGVPDGWLECNGQAVSRSGFAGLFAAIGTIHGAGNGTTTFNVPDSRGRVAMGYGTGPGLTPRSLGSKIGAEPMPAHAHWFSAITSWAADHVHENLYPNGQSGVGYGQIDGFNNVSTGTLSTKPAGGHNHSVAGPTTSAGSGSHGVIQPSIVLVSIIKT